MCILQIFFSPVPSQQITGAVVPLTLGIPSGWLNLRKEEMQISPSAFVLPSERQNGLKVAAACARLNAKSSPSVLV